MNGATMNCTGLQEATNSTTDSQAKRENKNMIKECIAPLRAAGIEFYDAHALRRIAMTLHRWHELECGDGDDYSSWTISRGRKKDGVFTHDESGKPFIERHSHGRDGASRTTYSRIPDRERGALRRLAGIMANYPTLGYYVQGDPRGASLYILRPGDVPEGQETDAYYSRGIAVYK